MPPPLPRLYTPLLRTSYKLPLHSLVLLYTPTVWSLLQYTSTHAPATILLLLHCYITALLSPTQPALQPDKWHATAQQAPRQGHPPLPLPSLTFQGRYIPLSSLSSLSFQSRNIPPSSLSLQGRDIPLSLPPATFQEGTLITDGSDRFLGGTRWCVPVWRTYDTKLDVCDKIWQRIGVAAKTELSFEKLWRFSGRNLH